MTGSNNTLNAQNANRIVLASENPVKRHAVQSAFERMFPGKGLSIVTVSVPSGVSRQPASDLETFQGAFNRAQAAFQRLPEADYWIGIEGGIDTIRGNLHAFAWVVIIGEDRVGQGRTASFVLPPEIIALIQAGKELGEADDIVFGRTNSKHENGAIGLLTGDVVDRSGLYEMAVVSALIPFKNHHLYPANKVEDWGLGLL